MRSSFSGKGLPACVNVPSMALKSAATVPSYAMPSGLRAMLTVLPLCAMELAGIQAGLWSGLCICAVRPPPVLAILNAMRSLMAPTSILPSHTPSMDEGVADEGATDEGVAALVSACAGARLKLSGRSAPCVKVPSISVASLLTVPS